MRKIYLFILFIFLLSTITTQAQTTAGTEFWVTFGQSNVSPYNWVDLQIRIVCGNKPTTGTIYFTNSGDSIHFTMSAYQVNTYLLNDAQKQAVYNTVMGISNYSIHITSMEPINVYAMNSGIQSGHLRDATNILPVTALGTEYYNISYKHMPSSNRDAYAVVATQNNTHLFHNGDLTATLAAGQVYYRTSEYNYADMTGVHVTSDKPVAFLAVNKSTWIPWWTIIQSNTQSHLMQQLAPVNTWGKNFFAPVLPFPNNFVRIVVSQNNTNITQAGGTLQTVIPGAQTRLDSLQVGQFIELKVGDTGCYIESDKPIGVCSFISGTQSLFYSVQCWIPAIEQTIPYTQIAPFKTNAIDSVLTHYALVVTSTDTKDDTKVSMEGALPTALTDGEWIDNVTANMSFYIMPLAKDTVSYTFTNPAGLIVLCYGYAVSTSYCYLAGSAMRNLDVAFYVNDIHYQDLDAAFSCERDFQFRAEIYNIGGETDSLKWYLNGVEEISAQNKLQWNKTLSGGDYSVILAAYPNIGEPRIIEGVLHVNAHISATPVPLTGGSVSGEGCFKLGEEIVLIATPAYDYEFVNWTTGATSLGTNNPLTLTVLEDMNLFAIFKSNSVEISVILIANPSEGGTLTGGGEYITNDLVAITATPNTGYSFVNWTENGVEISTEASHTFIATESRILTANFDKVLPFVTINIEANDNEYGYVTGSGTYASGSVVEAEAFVYDCYRFNNWTINNVIVSTHNPYQFPATENINLIANFYDLDFDTYTHIFFNNTFMLDMKKLADEGYNVIGCKWFKDGMEETDTRTINQFSYSLGPNATDLFDFETAIYKWQIQTSNYGNLCSSNKIIDGSSSSDKSNSNNLVVYPNPVFSGTLLTLLGAEINTPVMVYNALGTCVKSFIAKEDITTITLELSSGVYWIRNESKITKVVVVK